MTTPLPSPRPPRLDSFPVGPSVEAWKAMTPAARERFLDQVNEALSDIRIIMSEGRQHKKAKSRAVDMLELHFKNLDRAVYVAESLSVVYPGEPSFCPDVLAVLGVPQLDDDPRLAWVLADEGKGLDFVLEVLDRGDPERDKVENVERYGRIGVTEYFIHDRANQHILGHRLTSAASAGAARYEQIAPQGGRYPSRVLGLDLAIQGGTLRFFQGMSELFGSEDLIRRLTGLVESLEAKAYEAEPRADEAVAKAENAVARLRAGVIAALETRGIPVPDDARERVAACEDPLILQGWLIRALTAATAAKALTAIE